MSCIVLKIFELIIICIIISANVRCKHNRKYAIAEEEIFIMEKPYPFDFKLVENRIIDTFQKKRYNCHYRFVI